MPIFELEDEEGRIHRYEISQDFLDALAEGGWPAAHRLTDEKFKEAAKIQRKYRDLNREFNDALVDDLQRRAAKMFGDAVASQMKDWLLLRVRNNDTLKTFAERLQKDT